jgi:iron complex outermembrane receptor protein
MLYLSASEGFKAGGTNDNPLDVGIAFQPEEVLSYEFGVRSEFLDDRIRVNATYFTMDYTDKQITVAPTSAQAGFVNPCFDRCILNAGDGKLDGVELETLFAVTERFELHANAATLDARWTRVVPGAGVSLSSDFALAPELSYNVGGRFDVPTRGGGTVAMMLDYSFKGDQETSPQDSTTLTLPEHGLLTLRLKYAATDGKWDASVFCNNCANEEYVFGGSAWGATTANTIYPYKPLDHPAFVSGGISPYLIVVPDISYVLVGPPRMWGVDFRYNF